MKRHLKIIIPLALLIVGGMVGIAFFSPSDDPAVVRVSGNIEVTQVGMAFKIPGKLADRRVDEGEKVRKGQLIARLDAVDERLRVRKAAAEMAYTRAVLEELETGSRPEEIRKAQAQVEEAGFVLAELEKGSRDQEIATAQAELNQAMAVQRSAQSRLEMARADHRRYAALVKKDVVSRQSFESYETGLRTAENTYQEAIAGVQRARERLSLMKEGPRSERVRQAQAALVRTEAQYDLIRTGPRSEEIRKARARVEAARESQNLAEQRLSDTEIFAPFDGVVLSKSAEPGGYLNAGTPVVMVAEIENVWLRAFITETQLGRVRLGETAEVTTDTYGDKTYLGRVSFISSQAEFTPKTVQTFEERVKLMYRIKIDLTNPDGELKPGMPADARIRAAS